MDPKRNHRTIGRLISISLFAKKYNVQCVVLPDPNITLSHTIRMVMQRNMFVDEPSRCVKVLFPEPYGIKPITGLLSDEQIKYITALDNRILIEG